MHIYIKLNQQFLRSKSLKQNSQVIMLQKFSTRQEENKNLQTN